MSRKPTSEVRAVDEGMLLAAAARHTAENPGIGCECGFGVWSVEHAVVMAYREAKAVAEAASKPQHIPSEGDRVTVRSSFGVLDTLRERGIAVEGYEAERAQPYNILRNLLCSGRAKEVCSGEA